MYVASVTEALEECVGVIQDNCSMSSLYFQHFLIYTLMGLKTAHRVLCVLVQIHP